MQDPLMTESEVAEILNISTATLSRMRRSRENDGPPWIMVGGRPRYRRLDLERWLDEQAQKKQPARHAE